MSTVPMQPALNASSVLPTAMTLPLERKATKSFGELRTLVVEHKDARAHVLANYHVPKVAKTKQHGDWARSRREHERSKFVKAVQEFQTTGEVRALKPKITLSLHQ